MRVAIVENTRVTHHGQIGVALHEAGALVDQYKPWADGNLPEPGQFDALVVFGGEQSALSDDTHPYLPRLAALMADQAARGKSVLGICLGSQLFARGLGATYHIGTAPEFGWVRIERLAADPVLDAVPTDFPIFQWHSDTFTLPDGAQHLARSTGALAQSFRYGRAGYATQFHFEASRVVVADWTRRFPEACTRMQADWLDAHPPLAATLGAEADAHGLALARAFVRTIGG